MKEARFWEPLEGGKVKCTLCPRGCVIPPGQRGFCRIRANKEGTLFAVGYGETVSLAMDPMEKKPLYHFYPGSYILSLGCNGCNLACLYCQNWQISQSDVPTTHVSPRELVELAVKHRSIGLCFTYSEPLIWFEYILDVARIARPRGLKVVLVTNGIINPQPLEELLPWVDAMNVDLKSIRPEFYKKLCLGPYLDAVLHTIQESHRRGVWVEVTNLVIPGYNDSRKDLEDLVEWLAGVSREIPLHFSRFFPHYRLTHAPPTPIETLAWAWEMARERLDFVYVGNVWNPQWATTYCPGCGEELIVREGYSQPRINMRDGSCPACGRSIPVVM